MSHWRASTAVSQAARILSDTLKAKEDDGELKACVGYTLRTWRAEGRRGGRGEQRGGGGERKRERKRARATGRQTDRHTPVQYSLPLGIKPNSKLPSFEAQVPWSGNGASQPNECHFEDVEIKLSIWYDFGGEV